MDFPVVARDELIDQTASFNSNVSSFSSIGGTLRRSLRQINPFKSRLFGLPATPRLARAKKGLSRGEETTKWNFERPLSTCTASVGPQSGAQMYASIMSTSRPNDCLSSATPDSLSMTVPADSPAHLRHLKPPGDVGGSCRVRTTRHTRPPLPSYNPPNAREAEDMIHEHIQNLMVSSPRPLQRQFLLSYAPNGDLYDCRQNGRYRNDLAPSSPTHSTVSLLNTGRPNARSMSYGARDEPLHKPQYQLNGLFHQPSLRSLIPSNELTNLMNSNDVEVNNQLLFSFSEYSPDNAEVVFLGREWVFKELHQTVINEKTPISMIRGASGAGKSAIMKQLALHSPFYSNKQNNADTVDSGIVIGSQSSAESTLSSRNYEWLRMLGRDVCAYHECHLYAATSCSIPEFVRNLACHFLSAPSLRSYANIVNSNPKLMDLINNEAPSLSYSPIDLFRQLITEPLCKINEEKPLECVLIVVDAVDQAEFHRNENGESIVWLIKMCHKELPSCVRWILSASNETLPIASSDARSIWIDNDLELDERVSRDLRLIVDYRIAVNPSLGRCLRERKNPPSNLGLSEFVDEIIKRAKGNVLYISILMDMIEQERIQIRTTALSLLPCDLSQLYLLYFNCVFNSLQQFHAASIILSVVLASLRPLTFEQLYQIINSTQTDPQISIKDLEKRLLILQPFIAKLNSGAYVLIHNSLREFVLNGSNHTDYLVNVRYGHILHSLNFINHSTELPTESLFELAHHLLKANPHKYLPSEFDIDMPRDRDSQVKWLQIAAGDRIHLALVCERKNIYYPNSKVTRLLLMAGASPNSTFPDNDTLLCKYAISGNDTLIQLLIQYGTDTNSTNKSNGMTPLMLAIKNKHKESAQILMQCGAKIDVKDFEGKTALIHAASVDLELFSLIFENEWTNNEKLDDEKLEEIKLAFQCAVEANKIEICQYILDKTDILDLSTSLLIACCSGNVEVVQLLLSHGATLKLDQRWKGKSSLLCAIQSGHNFLTQTLLNDPNLKINTEVSAHEGWTPLIVASKFGHNGLIDELINKGCFIDSGDLHGCTAIGHAILNDHFAIANMLIKHGCNTMVVDNEGNTLLHFLALHYNKLLIETLLQLGLQVDTKNSNGLRAVEVAIMSDNKNSAELLLRRGARLRSITWLIASKHNPTYIVSLIKKLFDDGRTLYRRNRTSEALQRFNHALQKCNEFLQEDGNAKFISMNTSIKSIDSINNNNSNNCNNSPSLVSIRPQLRYFNCEILYTLADIHRQNSGYNEALTLSAEALRYADSEAALFQLHFFRARCFFDNRDLKNAANEAHIAASLRPDNNEVQVLLDALI